MAKENKELDQVTEDLKGVEDPVTDDFFEKVLNEDIQIPMDDDDNDDAGTGDSDKQAVKEESQKDQQEESVDALKARIAELEKEAKGRLGDVVKSRQDKAQLRSELDELKGVVSTLLDRRKNALENEEEKKVEPLSNSKKAIEFGDGDDAFVDLSEVKEAIAAATAKTQADVDAIKREKEMEAAKMAYIENVKLVVSENEELLAPAYDNLGGLYKELNEAVIAIQERTGESGEDGTISQDRALELIESEPEGQKFREAHPGIDPTRIARAYNSKVDLKAGLHHIAGILNKAKASSDTPNLDEKIQKAKNKPGSLAGQENRASDASNLIERIASLSVRDLEGLSDAEAAKIEAMLLKEELKSN